MKRYNYCTLLVLLLLALSIMSCDLTSEKRFTSGTVVITGMIYAGETITKENAIYIGRSVEIDEISVEAFETAFDSVFVRDLDTQLSKRLTFVTTVINNRPKIGYFDADSTFVIQAGHKYRVVAYYAAGDSTYGETTVPLEFTVVDNAKYVTDKADVGSVEMKHTEIDDLWPLRIEVDSPTPKVIYMEYYCLWNYDQFEGKPYMTMGDYLGMDIPVDKPEDYDSFMDGYPRKNKYFDKLIPMNGNILTIPFNQFNYLFYAPYRTTIYSVDDNFYKYIYKDQPYFHGGVQNGIGYFGSAYKEVRYTTIVKN